MTLRISRKCIETVACFLIVYSFSTAAVSEEVPAIVMRAGREGLRAFARLFANGHPSLVYDKGERVTDLSDASLGDPFRQFIISGEDMLRSKDASDILK